MTESHLIFKVFIGGDVCMPGASLNNDASIKYWNEVWLDQLIDEAFRLIREKADNRNASVEHGTDSDSLEKVPPSVLKL